MKEKASKDQMVFKMAPTRPKGLWAPESIGGDNVSSTSHLQNQLLMRLEIRLTKEGHCLWKRLVMKFTWWCFTNLWTVFRMDEYRWLTKRKHQKSKNSSPNYLTPAPSCWCTTSSRDSLCTNWHTPGPNWLCSNNARTPVPPAKECTWDYAFHL